MSHDVFAILDPRFRGDLWRLSRTGHVWLFKSPGNEALARTVWNRETEGYSPEFGVTTFDGPEDASEGLYGSLGMIEVHHGEYATPDPWGVIHVMGVPLDGVQASRVADELGLEVIVLEIEEHGFSIRRSVRQDDARDGPSHHR